MARLQPLAGAALLAAACFVVAVTGGCTERPAPMPPAQTGGDTSASPAVGVAGVVGAPASAASSDDRTQDAPGPGSARPVPVLFGLIAGHSPTNAIEEFEPLLRYLATKTGVAIEPRVLPSYAALATSLQHFEVHLAMLPPFTYVQAKRDVPELLLLATEITDGAPTHSGYIVTREDSRIGSLADLKGRRFGFVDPQSTTGYLYPLAYFRALGIDPGAYFKRTLFAGDHAKLVQMVQSGQIDAGATYASAVKSAAAADPTAKHLRILAKTGRTPLAAYCANPRLDAELVARVKQTLLSLSTRTEEGRQVLRGFGAVNGFVAVDDSHYDDVRRVNRLLAGPPEPMGDEPVAVPEGSPRPDGVE